MAERFKHAHNPILGVLIAPIERIQDLGADGKAMAAMLGIFVAVTADLTVLLLGVLIASSASDWFMGRAAAHKLSKFDSQISEWGLQSKIAGILLVIIIRTIELILYNQGFPDPHGAWAAATAAGLIYQDLDSLDRHRQTLGGRPIPILTWVLTQLRKMSDSLIPGAQKERKDP